TKLTLLLASLDGAGQESGRQLGFFEWMLPEFSRILVCANSLTVNWSAAFPTMGQGFEVVIGNPPWGQKEIVALSSMKAVLRERFPSSRGIFDWFRPFVELGIRISRPSGWFGMVLPDIVLLKDYEPTRRFLLDHLALEMIEWVGMVFRAATIDAVTI